MTNFGSILQFPEAPQSAAPDTESIEENGTQLLELRTEAGPVYVRPSRWQSIRLQWAFRNFRVLPPELLSRHDRRLIEKLSRTSVVTPVLPVPRKAVIGVVEKVRSRSRVSARVVSMRTELTATEALLAKPEIPELPRLDLPTGVKHVETREAPTGPKTQQVGDATTRSQQWRDLGALAAVGLIMILASTYRVPLFSSTEQTSAPQTVAAPGTQALNHFKAPDRHPAATRPLRVPPTTAAFRNAETPKRWVAAPPPEPTLARHESAPLAGGPGQPISARSAGRLAVLQHAKVEPAPMAPSATAERRFVSELPPGHFAHPVISEPNLVGELQLKALIAADGSVKKVTVVSGSPKLAAAGMRAVRQWHYSPYQVLGGPVEVETRIKMSFFGQDAVSIASVANGGQTRVVANGALTAP